MEFFKRAFIYNQHGFKTIESIFLDCNGISGKDWDDISNNTLFPLTRQSTFLNDDDETYLFLNI
jgi:hypothetical protein